MRESKTILLENGFEIPLANYTKQINPEYIGNPLIEALPPILSKEEAFDYLSHLPPFHKDEKNLSVHHRYHSLLRLSRVYQPINQTLNLEQKFSGFLRYGYVGRNPLNKNHVKVLHLLHEKLLSREELGLPIDLRSTASSFSLIGFPGTGKTSAIERILSLYPQVILHQEPVNSIQIVWLKLNCPHDGSLKTLCMDFFNKIDQLIGTNYYQKFGKRTNSISSMVIHMGQICRQHFIGALIVDEIQHLLSAAGTATETMMNFFVTLVNEIGIPIMYIGTMKARVLLQKDFRQARRSSGQGDMVWEPLKNEDDWEVFITSIWDYQWVKKNTEISSELLNCIHEESQGIVDTAVLIFQLAQMRAIETGEEKITTKLIRRVVKEDLKMLHPHLKAIKSGNPNELAKYEDIIPLNMEEIIQAKLPEIDLKVRIQMKKDRLAQEKLNKKVTIKEKMIVSLLNLDIEEKLAEKITEKILKQHHNLEIHELMSIALRIINEQANKKATKANPVKNVLGKIISDGKKNKLSAYEALYGKGYIKNPGCDFIGVENNI